MRLAIMQPYLFPYIGYYQLIASADRFVFYDDVSYIRSGWINRNRVKLDDRAYLFSVPLEDASSFRSIAATRINSSQYPRWRDKFLKTLGQAYKGAPYFTEAHELVEGVFRADAQNIAELCKSSTRAVCSYLGLIRDTIDSSAVYENSDLRGQSRVIDICQRHAATEYDNPL